MKVCFQLHETHASTESPSSVRVENLLETGSLLIPPVEVDLRVILGVVNWEDQKSLELSRLCQIW